MMLLVDVFGTDADKGKRAATAKPCKYINDAEPKTHKHMQQQNAANTEKMQNQNDTNPQNTCNREMLHIESTQRKCPHNGKAAGR